jgi:hypothetical protein
MSSKSKKNPSEMKHIKDIIKNIFNEYDKFSNYTEIQTKVSITKCLMGILLKESAAYESLLNIQKIMVNTTIQKSLNSYIAYKLQNDLFNEFFTMIINFFESKNGNVTIDFNDDIQNQELELNKIDNKKIDKKQIDEYKEKLNLYFKNAENQEKYKNSCEEFFTKLTFLFNKFNIIKNYLIILGKNDEKDIKDENMKKYLGMLKKKNAELIDFTEKSSDLKKGGFNFKKILIGALALISTSTAQQNNNNKKLSITSNRNNPVSTIANNVFKNVDEREFKVNEEYSIKYPSKIKRFVCSKIATVPKQYVSDIIPDHISSDEIASKPVKIQKVEDYDGIDKYYVDDSLLEGLTKEEETKLDKLFEHDDDDDDDNVSHNPNTNKMCMKVDITNKIIDKIKSIEENYENALVSIDTPRNKAVLAKKTITDIVNLENLTDNRKQVLIADFINKFNIPPSLIKELSDGKFEPEQLGFVQGISDLSHYNENSMRLITEIYEKGYDVAVLNTEEISNFDMNVISYSKSVFKEIKKEEIITDKIHEQTCEHLNQIFNIILEDTEIFVSEKIEKNLKNIREIIKKGGISIKLEMDKYLKNKDKNVINEINDDKLNKTQLINDLDIIYNEIWSENVNNYKKSITEFNKDIEKYKENFFKLVDAILGDYTKFAIDNIKNEQKFKFKNEFIDNTNRTFLDYLYNNNNVKTIELELENIITNEMNARVISLRKIKKDNIAMMYELPTSNYKMIDHDKNDKNDKRNKNVVYVKPITDINTYEKTIVEIDNEIASIPYISYWGLRRKTAFAELMPNIKSNLKVENKSVSIEYTCDGCGETNSLLEEFAQELLRLSKSDIDTKIAIAAANVLSNSELQSEFKIKQETFYEDVKKSLENSLIDVKNIRETKWFKTQDDKIKNAYLNYIVSVNNHKAMVTVINYFELFSQFETFSNFDSMDKSFEIFLDELKVSGELIGKFVSHYKKGQSPEGDVLLYEMIQENAEKEMKILFNQQKELLKRLEIAEQREKNQKVKNKEMVLVYANLFNDYSNKLIESKVTFIGALFDTEFRKNLLGWSTTLPYALALSNMPYIFFLITAMIFGMERFQNPWVSFFTRELFRPVAIVFTALGLYPLVFIKYKDEVSNFVYTSLKEGTDIGLNCLIYAKTNPGYTVFYVIISVSGYFLGFPIMRRIGSYIDIPNNKNQPPPPPQNNDNNQPPPPPQNNQPPPPPPQNNQPPPPPPQNNQPPPPPQQNNDNNNQSQQNNDNNNQVPPQNAGLNWEVYNNNRNPNGGTKKIKQLKQKIKNKSKKQQNKYSKNKRIKSNKHKNTIKKK